MTEASISVEDARGNRQVLFLTDATNVPDRARQIVDQAVEQLAERTGLDPDRARWALAAELVARHHDTLAYEREAARRGVLPL